MLNKYEMTKTIQVWYEWLKVFIFSLLMFAIVQLVPLFVQELNEHRPVYEHSVVRVVANSNYGQDQLVKKQIVKTLQANGSEMAKLNVEEVTQKLQTLFSKEQLHVEKSRVLIPPKRIGFSIYPQVMHKSFTVTIGKGRGDNWFCAIFPNVCVQEMKKPKKKHRFKLWENRKKAK